MKKIIKIKGGIGNQMFQYAYGRALEVIGEKIVFDISFFNPNSLRVETARDFKLNKFNLETRATFSRKKNYIAGISHKIKRRLGMKSEEFFQSEKYFKNIESTIRKEFTLKNPLSETGLWWQSKIEKVGNSVSLHVRRGDYIQDQKTNAFHGACDAEYYKKGIEKLTSFLADKNIEIFIFSDDIEWAKENLNFSHPVHFVSNSRLPDYEEMFLMSLCRHNIIANSTFSWWGAWLNRNPGKVVIGPTWWFANKTSDELGILPKEWIKI